MAPLPHAARRSRCPSSIAFWIASCVSRGQLLEVFWRHRKRRICGISECFIRPSSTAFLAQYLCQLSGKREKRAIFYIKSKTWTTVTAQVPAASVGFLVGVSPLILSHFCGDSDGCSASSGSETGIGPRPAGDRLAQAAFPFWTRWHRRHLLASDTSDRPASSSAPAYSFINCRSAAVITIETGPASAAHLLAFRRAISIATSSEALAPPDSLLSVTRLAALHLSP